MHINAWITYLVMAKRNTYPERPFHHEAVDDVNFQGWFVSIRRAGPWEYCREVYANLNQRINENKGMTLTVRGKEVSFRPQAIDEFLG